jgi:ribosomal protein S18 acetylase RimI-like enzyme
MEVREAAERDAAGMARVIIDSRRVAHRDHIPAEALLRFSYEESERNWRRALAEIAAADDAPQRIYVAVTAAGQVVGVAMGGPERSGHPQYPGEVYVLYLLPGYHRQGLGRRLMAVVAAHLGAHGMPGLLVRVLAANTPARLFYEALGGVLVLEEEITEDGVVLAQVAYGWPDGRVLVGRAASGPAS